MTSSSSSSLERARAWMRVERNRRRLRRRSSSSQSESTRNRKVMDRSGQSRRHSYSHGRNRRRKRSLSPIQPRRKEGSPSPIRSRRKMERSPTPIRPRRKERSPSPIRSRRKMERSPSPIRPRRKERSPSPMQPRRNERSPSPIQPRRKKARSPSPIRPRRKKVRSPCDSEDSRSSSPESGSHICSHRFLNFSSFQRCHQHKSGSSKRHTQCCCAPCRCAERGNRRWMKRKEKESSTSPSCYPGRGKHSRRSPSRDLMSSRSESKSWLKLKQRKQISCDVDCSHRMGSPLSDFGGDISLSGISDSAENGEVANQEDSRSWHCRTLQTPEDAKFSSLSHQMPFSGVCQFTRLSEYLPSLPDSAGPNYRRKLHEEALDRPEMDGNENGDWLNLSLKAPAKPTPNMKGISREDLKLSLDIIGRPSSESLEEGEIRAGHEAMVSFRAPSMIFTLTNSIGSGTQPREGMGLNKEPSSNNPSLARKLNTADQCLHRQIGDDDSYHIMDSGLNNFLKCPVSPYHDNVVELSDSSFEQVNISRNINCPSSPDHQVLVFQNSVGQPDGVSQISVLQTVGHNPELGAFGRLVQMHVADNDASILELSNSVSSQQDDTERRTSLLNNQEADSMERSRSKMETCKGQSKSPNFVHPLATCSQSKAEKQSQTFVNRVVELLDSSTDDDGDDQKQACERQAWHDCPSISSAMDNNFGTLEECLSSHLRVTPTEETPAHHSSLERSLSLNDRTVVVELSDSSAIPKGPRDEQTHVVPMQVSHFPTRCVVNRQSLHLQVEVLPTQRPVHDQFDAADYPLPSNSNIEVVELSDSLSRHSDASKNDVADSSECGHVLGSKISKSRQPLKNSRSPDYDKGLHHHVGFYVSDVACCSIKPPPAKTNRVSFVPNKVDEAKYARDKNGNLIQLFEVEDSDSERKGDNLQKRCDCLDIDVVAPVNGRGGDNLQAKFNRTDEVTDNYKDGIQKARQDIEQVPKIQGFQSEDCSDQNLVSQRSPMISLRSRRLSYTSFESRKKTHRSKLRKLVLEESGSNDSNESQGEAEREAGGRMMASLIEPRLSERWKHGIQCDLCNTGPSLSLGEWFAWCCGLPASRCQCAELKKMRKQMTIGFRKAQKTKRRGNTIFVHQWSGKVHKMCAVWSSEVFEKEYSKNHLRLLDAAVKRGNSLICRDPECRKAGATLGCRVKNCRRSYHYPCAERLASRCLLRMWDCLTIPIACVNHRYVEFEMDRAKEKLFPGSIADFYRDGKTPVSEGRHYIGIKLLCEDIAGGQEAVRIPCTNDVDDDPLPMMKYITKCWCKGHPVDNLHPAGTQLAKGCQGCDGPKFDNPEAPMSVHIPGTDGSRKSDKRLDWQSEYMYGRLPYDIYGLLQLGTESKDIVECNARCKCGPKCRNRELQKGLKVSLELFKTTDRGWGVRSLEQIPRGRFVVEYVGDVLTQTEADEKAEKYDESQLSYLFNLDHPGVDHEDAIVLDGIHMSNIARFINHSCEGNLMIYRVYSETTEFRYFRIGMFAIQDIEVGEELSYDYNYAVSKESSDLQVDDPTAIRCCCGAQSCRKWLWRGGNDSQLKH